MIIAVDPGDTTGVALFREDGTLISARNLSASDVMKMLADPSGEAAIIRHASRIVYEDFLLYSHKASAQTGSRFVTSQVIGMLKLFGEIHGIPLTRQPANILKMAAMHSEIPIVTHFDDKVSAYLHGFYYLLNQGTAVTPLQERERKRLLDKVAAGKK